MMRFKQVRWTTIAVLAACLGCAGCFSNKTTNACGSSGSAVSEKSVSFCRYTVGQYGVQESGFQCPLAFPVLLKSLPELLCFKSSNEEQIWQNGGNLPDGGDASNGDSQSTNADAETSDVLATSTTQLLSASSKYGECLGPCRSIVMFDGESVKLTITDYNGGLIYVQNAGQLTAAGKAAKLAAEQSVAGVSLQPGYGCPDCNDGGASFIDLNGPSGPSSHSYEAGNPPTALATIDTFYKSVKGALTSCTANDYVTLTQPICVTSESAKVTLTAKASIVAGQDLSATIKNGMFSAIYWPNCGGFYHLERYDDQSKQWATFRDVECTALIAYPSRLTVGASIEGEVIKLKESDPAGKYRLVGTYWTGCPDDFQVAFDGSACKAGPHTVTSNEFYITPLEVPSKQKVTFSFTSAVDSAKYVVNQGLFCQAFTITNLDTASPVTLVTPFNCACECPGPPGSSFYVKTVTSTQSNSVVWDARQFLSYQTAIDCAMRGWPDIGVRSVDSYTAQPVAAGNYRATFYVMTALPNQCPPAPAVEGYCGPAGPAGINFNIPICTPDATAVTVDFQVPQSGDISVPVALP